jgi:hypothetical protein
MQQVPGHILRMTGEFSRVAFVKLSYNICDLFVNVNKNDSYYTLFPKERKVFEKISCMKLRHKMRLSFRCPQTQLGKAMQRPTLILHREFWGWVRQITMNLNPAVGRRWSVQFLGCRATHDDAE